MAINTEMSDALRLFVGDVPGLENNLNSKYHKNSKWYPEASVEGGTKTVGFGHKLGKNPEVDELVRRQGYLTDEQNQAAFYKRGTVAFNDAKAVYDAEIGRGSFDRLDSRVQAVLTDYAYNLGRSGFAKYRKFMHGIADGDFDQIQKEYVRHVNGKPLGNRNAWALGLLASVYDAPKPAVVDNKVEGRPFMSAGQYYYPASDYSRALVEQQHRIYNMEHPQNPMVAGIERMRAKGYPRGEGDAYDGTTNAALAGILAGGIGLGKVGIDATTAMLNRAFTPKTGVGKAAETLFDSYITVDSANELGKKISGQPSETSLADDLWGLGIAAVPVTKVVNKIAGVTPMSALYAEGGPLAWRNEAPTPQEQKVAPDAPVPYTRDMFRTSLDPVEEQLFKRWYSKVSKRLGISEDPDAPEHHYDYRGYWRKEGRNVPAIFMGRNWHFPDTYKTPWHETFSTDSIYSTPEHTGGTWDGDKFIDSDWTRSVRETGNYLSVGGKLDFINNKVVKWLADGGNMSSKGAAELSQWLADNGFAGVLNIPEAPNVFAAGGSTDREERKRNKSLTEAILRKAENERKAKLIASGHPQDAPLVPMEQEIMGWTDAGDAMAIGEAIYRRDPILGAAAVAGAVLPGVSSKAIQSAVKNLGGGYMLKSLMRGNPLEKQISKNGTVNVNNVRAVMGKASKVDQAVVDKVLASEEFAGKKAIDYNQFRKAVQDELITYNRTPDTRWEDYGMDRLGYGPNFMGAADDYRISEGAYAWAREHGYKPDLDAPVDVSAGDVFVSPSGESVSYAELEKLFMEDVRKNRGAHTYTFSSPRIPLGSARHYDPNTLGHSRTFTTMDEPDVLHVMESQSDWAQSGAVPSQKEAYKRHVDRLGKEHYADKRKQIIQKAKDDVEHWEEMLKSGKRSNGEKLESHEIAQVQDYLFTARDRLAKLESELPIDDLSFPQIEYLSNNYTTRQIQENLRYAAEKGQSKMRYPTRETAAKIEGYPKVETYIDERGIKHDTPYEYDPDITAALDDVQRRFDAINRSTYGTYPPEYEQLSRELGELYAAREASAVPIKNAKKVLSYADKYEGILKKYDAFPKQYQKLFKDADVRTVADPKGNTWYEVDVPKDYLNLEWPYANGGKLYGNDGDTDAEYYDIIPETTVTATLPSIKSRDGVRIAKNMAQRVSAGQMSIGDVPRKYQSYVNGEVKGAMHMTKFMNEQAWKVPAAALAVPGSVIGGAELAAAAPVVAAELKASAPFIGNTALRMARDIPAFEVMDRLPTLWGDERISTKGGDATQWLADNTVNKGGNATVSSLSRLPGELAVGALPGLAGDVAMRGLSHVGSSAVDALARTKPVRRMAKKVQRIKDLYATGRMSATFKSNELHPFQGSTFEPILDGDAKYAAQAAVRESAGRNYTTYTPIVPEAEVENVARNIVAPDKWMISSRYNFFNNDLYWDNGTPTRLVRIMENSPEYAEFINAHRDMDPLAQSTIDAFAKKQATAMRGVAANASDAAAVRSYLTEPSLVRAGGDRLGSNGGVYTSNSRTIGERFMHPVTGKADGVLGTLRYPVQYDPSLPIEDQLLQIRSGFFNYDDVIGGLSRSGYSTSEYSDITRAAKNAGYFAGESMYTTRNGNKLPAFERVYLGKEPLQITKQEVFPALDSGRGRWGIGGIPAHAEDETLFYPVQHSEADLDKMKKLVRALNKADVDYSAVNGVVSDYAHKNQKAVNLIDTSLPFRIGLNPYKYAQTAAAAVLSGTASAATVGAIREKGKRFEFAQKHPGLAKEFWGEEYPPKDALGRAIPGLASEMLKHKDYKKFFNDRYLAWKKQQREATQ